MSPFDLTGESFLALFFSLIPPVFGLAAWLRWRARVPSAASDPSVTNLDPYAMAFLAGGPVLALNAAIASLVQRGVLETDEKEAQLSAIARAPENAHPLERRIYLQVSGATPVKISELRPEMQGILEWIQSTLQELGLVVTDTDRLKARLLPLLLVFALFGFGVIQIVVGLERNRPVGFLSATCVVVLGAGLVAFARRPHRTRRGDHVLDELRARHATLQTSLRSAPAEAITASLPLAVGLFGMSALADTPWSKLEEKLSPARCSSGCGGGAACGGGGGGCGGGCGGG